MANILLLDDSDVAGRAMHGILSLENHTGYVTAKAEDAWRMLREGVLFDLVFLELNMSEGGGIAFLQKLREDWFWKILPVVAYTTESDSRMVRRAMALKVQKYLIKPYREESILLEVAKTLQNPWRNLHFDEPESFCALMELSPDDLTARRQAVQAGFEAAAKVFPSWAENRDADAALAQIKELVASTEGAGIWAGGDYLRDLQLHAATGNWAVFKNSAEYLSYASRLIRAHLDPAYIPECLSASRNTASEWQTVFKY